MMIDDVVVYVDVKKRIFPISSGSVMADVVVKN